MMVSLILYGGILNGKLILVCFRKLSFYTEHLNVVKSLKVLHLS